MALPFVWVGSGALVWLLARNSAHIGASGVVYGLMAWIIALGILRRTREALMLMLVALFLYGGLIWGVLPLDPSVSFEAHLAGALTGVVAGILTRRLDPLPPPPVFDEDDGEA